MILGITDYNVRKPIGDVHEDILSRHVDLISTGRLITSTW